MAYIYFLRHGSTPAHEGKVDARRAQGREEVFKNKDNLYEMFKTMYDLSEFGKYQAYTAGGMLLSLGADAKNLKVFSSPQSRTREAAEIACSVLSAENPIEIEELESLNVIEMGSLTGMIEGNGEGEFNPRMLMHPQSAEKYGTEPIPEFMQRIGKAFKVISASLKEGGDVLVSGHVCGIPLLMTMATRPQLFKMEGLSREQIEENTNIASKLYLDYDKIVSEGSVIRFNTETKELDKVCAGQNQDGPFETHFEQIYSPNQSHGM